MSEKQVKTSTPERDEHGRLLPGNTANPNGRPRISITRMIKEKILEVPFGQRLSYLEQLIELILDEAIVKKDTVMQKQIWEQLDGKPKQVVQFGDEDDPVTNVKIEVTKNATQPASDNGVRTELPAVPEANSPSSGSGGESVK